MFKKLKDKIAEEVKISPLKLQTSVQQLAQAMVSPSSSVSSIQETTSNDNFSIAEESEVSETPRNSPDKVNSTFHRVDLQGDTVVTSPRYPTVPRSRRSSGSSMMSDVSSLFPLYESPSNAYHFQSDLESTSEIEEISGSTSHLQGISKEQLLTAYRKTQSRYHKYKGRYVDLARHFRELERECGKIKVLLTDTQDRACRKIAELKEQCTLEQKAKAHLEEALRNDLEEKDHLINALETKVKLLKSVDASETCGQKQNEMHEKPLIHLDNKQMGESQNLNISSLQEEITSLKSQLLEHQQSLKEHSEKLNQLNLEKEKVDKALVSQEAENQKLKRELEAQRKREEEAALSLAENKMQVHRELEAREEESKNLKALVAQLQEDLRISNRKKAIGNGERIAASSESISSSVFEEAVSGDDSLPSQPVSELNQLKEVLRKKYKEVEILVEENGRLRASLIMSNSENGCLEKKLVNSENFIQPELENIVSNEKSKKNSPEEVDLLQVQCSEELLLKNSVGHEVLSVTNELNKKNIDLSLENQAREEAEIERQLSDAKNELEKVTSEWQCKFSGVKGELDKLLLEKAEVIRLLSMQEVPAECMDDCDGNMKNRESLLQSTISVLREKSSWKREEERLVMKLKDLDNECGLLKGMLEKVENEKGQLEASTRKSMNEVSLLNNEVKGLKEFINKLKTERDSLQEEVLRLQDISTKFEKLKNEAENYQTQSKISIESMELQFSSKLSKISSELEEKERELQLAKADLEEAVSSGVSKANKMEEELLDKCRRLEKDLTKERELRLFMEQSAKASQMELYKEFVTALGDGKSLLHEALENVKKSEREKDRLKAENEGLCLRDKENNEVVTELRQLYEKQLKEIEEFRLSTLKEMEDFQQERTELKNQLVESQKKAISALSQLDPLMLKNQEAENRAAKVQKELKAMRELEEKAKVEAEEAVHEQAAMRRSWEMQRDQIESMSREIEELKKAEDGLIRVLKEVREEVKNKDCEISSLVEESLKEKSVSLINEEKMKSEVSGLKSLIEQHTLMEEQIRKEMEKVKEASNEWKAKSDVHEQELEAMNEEKKILQRKLEEQESSQLKSIEAIKRLTDELTASVESKRRLHVELDAVVKEIEMTKRMLDESKREVEILVSKNEELKTMEMELKEKLEMIENERNGLINEKKETEEVIGKLKEERDQYKCQAEKSQQEIERLEIKLDELEKSHEEMKKERENERIKEEMNRKNLEGKISELINQEEKMIKELEVYHSQSSKGLNSTEDNEDFEREKGVITEMEGEKDLIKKLEAERDEALKNLDETNDRIKTLEEKILSLENVIEAEKEEHSKEVFILKEEINARNESLKAQGNNADVEEELKRITEIKAELEENLLEVQKQAEKKNELESRVDEMEQLMKTMEKEFDAAIVSKEEEYQEQLSTFSERMEQEVGYVKKQLMEEIKGLREQLIAKRDAYDELMEKHNSMVNESKVEIDTVRRKLTDQMNKAVKIETSKWMDHISELETNHRKSLEDLQRKWDAERKSLEETSRVAVAAVESGTGSMSFLKQQIQAQAKELSETKRKYNSEILELRHLLSLGRRGTRDLDKSRIDDSTELEYLRNILYEYMMGKEPMVLARVIAAVVKFDDEQTKKVLTKEEQKQTLLGQFGLT